MESVQLRLMDRISNLPDNIIDYILMKLPTRDAVRTSILSTKWRHVKDKLSQFVLDYTLWNHLAKGKGSSKTTPKEVLCQLLLGHDGPINKFKLKYSTDFGSCTEVDNLISFLCKRHIQKFSLEMYEHTLGTDPGKVGYLVPFSILSCPTLRHLNLRSCSIRSFASVGLRMLTSLKLHFVSISAETLASLISGSPLITILEINTFDEFDICIDAPNMTTLTIIARHTNGSIKFKRVPVLASVSIKMTEDADGHVDVTYGDTNIGFFECLCALETLRLSYQVVQNIGLGIPKKLPTTLLKLEEFVLSGISLNNMVDLKFTLYLLRSSPDIEYIAMHMQDQSDVDDEEEESMGAYMEEEDFSNIRWSKLSEVQLSGFTGTMVELEFTRLLLAKSSSLKKIRIQPAGDNPVQGLEILKEISAFPRISKKAQVIFDDYLFERDHFLDL